MDTGSLLESFGYFIIFASVFIECGVPIGLVLPLPGGSLLFTAGVFAATGRMDLDIVTIIIIGSIAAIAGYITGYATGHKYGRKLFYRKTSSKYFNQKQGRGIERFMQRYGYVTLIGGRFLPVMHSAAPLLSGIARTPLAPFMVVNVIGGVLWTLAYSLTGFYIGQSVPGAEYYVIPFVILTIIFMNSPYGKRLYRAVTKKIERM